MDGRVDEMPTRRVGSGALAAARAVAEGAAGRAGRQDHDGGFPAEDVAALARFGLLAAPVPRAFGGLGTGEEAGAGLLRAVLTRIGYGSLALGRVYEGHVNALQLIALHGDREQQRRLFADAHDGHLFGVWNTEPPGAGLNLDRDGPTLRGVKTFASGAGFVTRPLVTARDAGADASFMLVVPLEKGERADLSRWRAQGMRASATGTLDFTGLRVGRDAILGGPDSYHRQPQFSAGAWRFLAVQLGGLEAVLDAWRAHLVATGRGDDPHQLARLGEGAIASETARLWVERAAAAATDAHAEPAAVVAYVDLARLAVERAGLDLLRLAQRSVGLQGFMADHPLERLSRDLATYLRQPGPDRALTEGARHVLRDGAEAGDIHLSIALGGSNAHMAEHLLDSPQIGPAGQ